MRRTSGATGFAMSASLKGADDLDRVAGAKFRLLPGIARYDFAVQRDRNATGVSDLLGGVQPGDRGCAQRLGLAIDLDGCVIGHTGFHHSAASARCANRSMPKA